VEKAIWYHRHYLVVLAELINNIWHYLVKLFRTSHWGTPNGYMAAASLRKKEQIEHSELELDYY
jgi:hypothetical protein